MSASVKRLEAREDASVREPVQEPAKELVREPEPKVFFYQRLSARKAPPVAFVRREDGHTTVTNCETGDKKFVVKLPSA